MEFVGLVHLFVTVFLYTFASFMVIPAITDVTMTALCPGEDECSLAIYLSGFQQAVTGVGSLIMMPIVGNLSDSYGRKALLSFPMTLTIFPVVILAYNRSKYFYYGHYVIKTLTAMFCDGSVHCLALAYVADNVPEGRRASAFGLLSGIASFAFVCGTLTARFLSTSLTFQVSAVVAVVAIVYMRVFLKDSIGQSCQIDASSPLLGSKPKSEAIASEGDSCQKMQISKGIPSVRDMVQLLKTSITFTQAAIVAFFNNLGEGGLHASLLYFLKAQFQFNKNQFADLMLISGVAGTTSQLVLMPMLAPHLGEVKLLRIGLLAGCASIFLYSVSWAAWVPYLASSFTVLGVLAPPCIRSIASNQVGPEEQGMAQGCISGLCSMANIVSPLTFTPLTALFLSDNAPFHFPGFSIMCTGLAMMMAFIQSLIIRSVLPVSSPKTGHNTFVA